MTPYLWEGGGGADAFRWRIVPGEQTLSFFVGEETRFAATIPRAKRSSSFCPFYSMYSKIGLTIANLTYETFPCNRNTFKIEENEEIILEI
jgi:hypothetical protein